MKSETFNQLTSILCLQQNEDTKGSCSSKSTALIEIQIKPTIYETLEL